MEKKDNNVEQRQAQFEADYAQFEAKQAQQEQEQVPVVLGEKVPASNMFQEGKFQGWSVSERINGCLYALECFERGPNVGVHNDEVEEDLTGLFERVEKQTLTAADWQRLENALLEDDLQFLQNLQYMNLL
jgi:hypothetical protein